MEERLEENEPIPIQYGTSPFFELELHTLENLAFSVADNPFVKSDTPKFLPECIFVDGSG
jgi:hypothetical protein